MRASHRRRLDELARGAFRRPGLDAARLFAVDPDWVGEARAEALRLVAEADGSSPTDTDHVTNWVNPWGEARQFSLWNRSGLVDDTSSDHDGRSSGKRFTDPVGMPRLASLAEAIPDLVNFRLNLLGSGSGLSPHEEQVHAFARREVTFRLRIHVPLLTNPSATLLVGSRLVHFEPGWLYAFNNGCVHSAANAGDEARVHVVADVRLTERAVELLLGDGTPPPFLRRVPPAERSVPTLGSVGRGPYRPSGRGRQLHQRLRLDRAGIADWWFQDAWVHLDWARYRVSRLSYAHAA